MTQLVLKVILAACLIVAAAEIGKRSALLGAILISLPLASILALSFLYYDTRDAEKVIALSKGILLMILPSMAFFGFLILLLKWKQPYWLSLLVSSLGMAAVFAGYAKILERFNIKL